MNHLTNSDWCKREVFSFLLSKKGRKLSFTDNSETIVVKFVIKFNHFINCKKQIKNIL